MKDIYIYPAIFDYAEDGINVSFPDLTGCLTCGNTEEDAFHMAKEALEGWLYISENDKDPIPKPSSLRSLGLENNQSAVLIEVNMKVVRYQEDNKAVKKTVTIPKWLDVLALESKVNFSLALEEKLKEILNVKG